MAKRRMFSLDICDTDKFLDMPSSSQALYFHLGLRADDDGFVSSPVKITTLAGCSKDDLNILVTKGYIIPFQSGVCVIADWRINNYLRADRYSPTIYTEEKALLCSENPRYSMGTGLGIPDGIPEVNHRYPQVRIGEVSVEKSNLNICAAEPHKRKDDSLKTRQDKTQTAKAHRFTPPTVEEVAAYCKERNNGIDAEAFVAYYEANGWRAGRNPMRSWKAAVQYWERRNVNGTGNNRSTGYSKPTSGKAQNIDSKWGIK